MKNYVVIDVREPDEFATGHVSGAINIPPDKLLTAPAELGAIPEDAPIIVYCRTGSRSNVAMHILRQMGFTNLENGINADQVRAKYGL